MNSSIIDLAKDLGIDINEIPPHQLANQVCTTVLHNIYNAESAPVKSIHWNHGMTYLGIGRGQIETEIEEIISSGMATKEDLLSICDRMDNMLKASEKLYFEIERFLPHKTFDTKYKNITSAWRGGFGLACSELKSTHQEFKGGCKSTTARIRAALKRRETIAEIEQQDALEKSGMHKQIGMGL